MVREGLQYKGRPLCSVLRPFFIARSQYDRVQRTARKVRDALLYVAAHALQSDRHRALLGLSPTEMDLLSGTELDDDAASIGRIDGFLDEDGQLRLLEYNGESPGGIAYGDALGSLFDDLPTIRGLRETLDLDREPVVPSVIESFIERYDVWARRNGQEPADHPAVAIVDTGGQPTYREFEIFAEAFESQGMPAIIATPEQLDLKDNRLVVDTTPIDIVYRRLVTPDLLELDGTANTLILAMKQGIVHVCNSFGGHLLSHKGLFAVFSDPELTPRDMDPSLRSCLNQAIPWTRFVTDCPELTAHAMKHQQELVLKPVSGYGGTGVVLGWECNTSEWEAALTGARANRTIIQERLAAPTASFPIMGKHGLEKRKLLFDTCPYVLGGENRHGLGVRISELAILNMAAGAGSALPTYVVNGC